MIKGPQYSLNIWGRTLKSARIQFSTIILDIEIQPTSLRILHHIPSSRGYTHVVLESNAWPYDIDCRNHPNSRQSVNQMLWLLTIFLLPVLIIFLKLQYKLYSARLRDRYIQKLRALPPKMGVCHLAHHFKSAVHVQYIWLSRIGVEWMYFPLQRLCRSNRLIAIEQD